jgi:periplasmic divalent cation tolerance protein
VEEKMNPTGYSVVLTTTASDEETEKIAHALLAGKLAACVQATQVKSCYTWKGEVRIDHENLLFIKCKATDYAGIEECIRANHSYEVPEIVQLPLTAGSQDYLDWISQVTL